MKKLLTIFSITSLCLFADEFVEESTTIGGYGEMHYDMEAYDGDGKLDFHRFIFYIKHTFNDQWSMMSEIEIEHNMVYSEGDGGYLAMEQAYLNYWNDNWGFRGGVLLIPAGITNEFHEPPTFMSVERPEYNKYIIPTTWFDNGFSFYGKMNNLNWNFTMVGDLNGDEIGEGVRDARMKGHYSSTASWTKTLQVSWAGMDGLKVGGSITMNDAPASLVADLGDICLNEAGDALDASCENEITRESIGVSLTEFNATYSNNNWYTRVEHGTLSYTDNLHQMTALNRDDEDNTLFDTNADSNLDSDDDETYNVAGLKEVESSSGHYIDLGYNLADMVGCDGDLYLWTRTSSYNKNDDDDAKDISLFGVTYKPTNNIAIKFESGTSGDDDVMRMGLGYMF